MTVIGNRGVLAMLPLYSTMGMGLRAIDKTQRGAWLSTSFSITNDKLITNHIGLWTTQLWGVTTAVSAVGSPWSGTSFSSCPLTFPLPLT